MSFFGKTEKDLLDDMGYSVATNLKSLGDYTFPEVVVKRTQDILGCTNVEMDMIQIALLDYFLAVKIHGGLEMIDKKADELWHIFLLDTKSYMDFCSNYLGFFLHHNPYISDKEVTHSEQIVLANKYESARKTDSKFETRRSEAVRNSDDDMLTTYLPLYIILSDNNTAIATQVENDRIATERAEAERTSTPVYADTTPSYDSTPSSSYDSSSKSSCSSSCSSSSSSSSCGSSCGGG